MTRRTSAEALEDHIPGELLAQHKARSSKDVLVQILSRRQCQESIIVPAVPEPMLVWVVSGAAVVEERIPGGVWMANRVAAGDFFLTTSSAPTEMRWQASGTQPFRVMHLYIGLAMLKDVALREVSGEKDDILSTLLEPIRRELTDRRQPNGAYIQGLAQALTVHLARTYEATDMIGRAPRGGLQAYKLHRVFEAMASQLTQPFDLARLAALVQLSEFHFSRVFKQSTGMSPSRYVIRLRMEHAKRLLVETDAPIIVVGMDVGYQSPSHFAARFRKETGVSPSEYRSMRQTR